MTRLIDGMNLKLSDILNGKYIDIHGHEIIFEKTGHLEYSSVYNINCNRKYTINLSNVIVTVNETIVPDKYVVFRDEPYFDNESRDQNQYIDTPSKLYRMGYENYV
ncbi:MAG: hypothetical protein ACTHKF_08155 [Candidatus Nitrosocosmicus sp.]